MNEVTSEQRDGVAVLRLVHPPVNGIGLALRSGLLEALDRALADPATQAIVVTGGEKIFSGGADVSEFGSAKSMTAPFLTQVITALEDAGKPVVAAIGGHCLGGGLELALGCHWRVAHVDALLGLPEVKFGQLPGAGGTQRLPRAVGLETALNMIVTGDPVPASQLAGTDLIDEVVSANVVDAAVAFARRAVAVGTKPRRLRELKVRAPAAEAYLQFVRTTVKAKNRFLSAPPQCVEAVANAVSLPFDEALKRERAAFISLMNTPESRALRHAFFAERDAAKVERLLADTPVRPIRCVGVVGAGTMGGGITMALINVGIPVVLLEVTQAALVKGLVAIRRNYEGTVAKGKLAPEKMAAALALITPTLTYDALGDADLVIEAVVADMGVKAEVFALLAAVCRPGAILASNTSALDLNQIAQFTKRPADVIGLHFFSPANLMRLLEVVRGAATADDVLATAMALAKRMNKVAVVAGVCDGFIGNRMLARYSGAANELLDLGALPQQVDRALEAFGFAMGPFRVGDLAGLDIGWARRKRWAAENPGQDFAACADRLCEAGRFGQKTGAGWYRYEPGSRAALPDPEVTKLIDAWRAERGCATRVVSEAEIVERCVYALANEGARILADGIAQRAGDIDTVYLNGYGFPRFRGGPMKVADEAGLPIVARALRRIAAESGASHWQPAPLLSEHAAQGRTFT